MLFDGEYEIFLANTEESKALHYALRYQVYCQEMQLEDPSQFSDGLEVDEWDASSIHFIARSKKTKEWVSAIRLIVGPVQQLPTYSLLTENSFQRRRLFSEAKKSESGLAAEISRVCILSSCRHRGGSVSIGVKRKRQPEIFLGMLRAAYAYCLGRQIDVCLFTVVRPVTRILKRLELNFIQLGAELEYHGTRSPCSTHIPSFLGNISVKSPSCHAMFTNANAYRLYQPPMPLGLFEDQRENAK